MEREVRDLVRKAEKRTTTQVKRIPFQNDPELKRITGTLSGFRGSRRFLYDGHKAV
jgi:hypothetical protein